MVQKQKDIFCFSSNYLCRATFVSQTVKMVTIMTDIKRTNMNTHFVFCKVSCMTEKYEADKQSMSEFLSKWLKDNHVHREASLQK